jgi:hydrogenase maturation factor
MNQPIKTCKSRPFMVLLETQEVSLLSQAGKKLLMVYSKWALLNHLEETTSKVYLLSISFTSQTKQLTSLVETNVSYGITKFLITFNHKNIGQSIWSRAKFGKSKISSLCRGECGSFLACMRQRCVISQHMKDSLEHLMARTNNFTILVWIFRGP